MQNEASVPMERALFIYAYLSYVKKLPVIFLFILAPLFSIADSGPKFTESVQLRFYENGLLVKRVDSIIAVVNPNRFPSIAAISHNTIDYWAGHILEEEPEGYSIFTHQSIQEFSVLILKGGKEYRSAFMTRYPANAEFRFELVNGKLKDVSPLFHQSWGTYFFALFLTILIEVMISYRAVSKKDIPPGPQTFLWTFILLNILTHFTLWYVYSHFHSSLFQLEIGVMFVEILYWSLFMRFRLLSAIHLGVWTNLASWIIGWIIF